MSPTMMVEEGQALAAIVLIGNAFWLVGHRNRASGAVADSDLTTGAAREAVTDLSGQTAGVATPATASDATGL